MSLKDELKDAGVGELARQLESTKDYGVSVSRVVDMQESVTASALERVREFARVNEEVAGAARAFARVNEEIAGSTRR